MSSTDRSPWASTSTISARRPLPSPFATSANASNRASLAARSLIMPSMGPVRDAVKYSNDYLTAAVAGMQHVGMPNHSAKLFVAADGDRVFSLIVSPDRLPE